jgi:hypothetical protein
MPKLNPLFFEEKTKTYQSHGKPAFIYGEPEMRNLFEASLYNFNPTVRDKVLNELNDILPKEKIDENKKFDLRKKFQDSEVLSEFGINKGLKGPVTRLLIKDLGDDVINNINFIRYPRTEVGHYINYLKDKVDKKYKKQFQLVNNALTDIKYNNYNGAKQKLNIAENINFDHKVPKYLIDAGYADELEYIKLNPVGENFNQLTKRDNFDKPMAKLSRKYEATNVPEEKANIIEKMNDIKDNFNKRYNNYLSDVDIKEVNGKLNFSSSAKPITSSDELIKTLETNVKENPEFFKLEKIFDNAGVTQKEREALNSINNQFSSGANPEFIKKLYAEEIDMAGNAIKKIGRTGANALKTFEDVFISFGRSPGARALGLAAVAPEVIHSGQAGLKGDYKEMSRIIPTLGTFGLLPESLNIPGTDIDIGKGSTSLDIVKHAQEKGLNSTSVKKVFDKNELANRMQDADDLLNMGSKNEDFIKRVKDKKESLKNEYDNIDLNKSDWKNFANSVFSFHERNRNRSLSAIQDRDTLNRDVENDYNETFNNLNPILLNKYNIGTNEKEDNYERVGIGEEGYKSPDEISTGYNND